jgi:hypothetical protein
MKHARIQPIDSIHTETYKPILKEVERILSEAGLDAEEMKHIGAGGGTSSGSRNRR